jgi:hypothetical protein
MEIQKIIGLKVVAIKGVRTDMRRKKHFYQQYILFDDGKTYIELDDQDYYTYHDCDSGAKRISVWQDESVWRRIIANENHYPDADMDINWY